MGYSAPVAQALLQGLQPVILLLSAERPQPLAAVDAGFSEGVAHQALPKIGLQLTTRWCLKPHCRQDRMAQFPPPGHHGTLHRTQAHANPLLQLQLLPHHIGIATMG